MPAVIKELTGVRRHSLHGDSAAFRTGKGRSQQHQAPPSARISGCSIKLQSALSATIAVATQSMMRVALLGAGAAHVASVVQARRFGTYRPHPAARRPSPAIDSGTG